MDILLDNGTPRGIARFLEGHTVREARELGWDQLKNGELLDAAEAAGFGIFITTDKNIRHQQNLGFRHVAIIVLGSGRWTQVKLYIENVRKAVSEIASGGFIEVAMPLVRRTDE